MFDKSINLAVGSKDLELIEAALHTQSKILVVQASAGGVVARSKLKDIKQLLSTLESYKPEKPTRGTAKLRLPFMRWMTS